MRSFVCAALFLSAAGLVFAQDSRAQAAAKPFTVDIKNVQGQSVGTATLTPAAKGVKITLDIKNLPPGEHSLHIHQVPKCEPPDFKSAGPHFGGGHTHEGMQIPAGDIPDFALIVGADGTAHASTIAPNVTLGTDANHRSKCNSRHGRQLRLQQWRNRDCHSRGCRRHRQQCSASYRLWRHHQAGIIRADYSLALFLIGAPRNRRVDTNQLEEYLHPYAHGAGSFPTPHARTLIR